MSETATLALIIAVFWLGTQFTLVTIAQALDKIIKMLKEPPK